MTPRQRVLATLRGQPVDKVPFTIYECMIPQCAVERRLRSAATPRTAAAERGR